MLTSTLLYGESIVTPYQKHTNSVASFSRVAITMLLLCSYYAFNMLSAYSKGDGSLQLEACRPFDKAVKVGS
jgi:hypothetical protein